MPIARGFVAAAALLGALLPIDGFAQVAPTSLPASTSSWQYTVSIYGYLPSVGGTSSFPADSGGTRINVDGSKILDKLKFFGMGTGGVHNGTWGAFTDVIYLNFAGAQSGSRDFTIGNSPLPADASASFDWDLKGSVWTLAGDYRIASDPSYTIDVLAGARLLDIRQRLRWTITGSLGPLDPLSRSGESSGEQHAWDAIVGVKGRYGFGENKRWAVPFYFDIGAGESASTQQAAAGLAYAFSWGEVSAMWRYLGYNTKADKGLQDFHFTGPLIAATFRW